MRIQNIYTSYRLSINIMSKNPPFCPQMAHLSRIWLFKLNISLQSNSNISNPGWFLMSILWRVIWAQLELDSRKKNFIKKIFITNFDKKHMIIGFQGRGTRLDDFFFKRRKTFPRPPQAPVPPLGPSNISVDNNYQQSPHQSYLKLIKKMIFPPTPPNSPLGSFISLKLPKKINSGAKTTPRTPQTPW